MSCSCPPGNAEFSASCAQTQANFSAALAGNPQSIPAFTPEFPQFNLAEGACFMPFGPRIASNFNVSQSPVGPLDMPPNGAEFPSLWRDCPGVDAWVRAEIKGANGYAPFPIRPPWQSQGNSLYLKWTSGAWDPFLECGSSFFEHYMYRLDSVIGRKIRYRISLALDAGQIEVIPMVWVNWHNDQNTFLYGPRTILAAHPTNGWNLIETFFQIPPLGSNTLSDARYLAMGMTMAKKPTAEDGVGDGVGLYMAGPEIVT